VSVEDKLRELGVSLPTPPKPVGNYVGAVQVGSLVFFAGHPPERPDGTWVTGKLGQDISIEDAYEAARLCGVNLLATLKSVIGDLDRVKRIVKLLSMVNCTPDFGKQPAVANGASDFLVAVFGEKGRHARSAVGMGSLPGGIPVEVEMIVEVEP